jgi:hypothetical protein
VVERYRDETIIRYFRGDAAFADPNIYCFLETEEYVYAIRLKGNNILQSHIEHLLTRPVIVMEFWGKPSMEWIFLDQVAVNFLKLSISLGEKHVFNRLNGKYRINKKTEK